MLLNDKFNTALDKSGLSMYALSKRSGIPYTTINEIHRGQNDINHCAAGTVWRLAAALDVAPSELMNDISYLDGIKGKYKGINYIWSTEDNSVLEFNYDGNHVNLDAGAFYNIPSRLPYYEIIAGMMIDEYLNRIQWIKDSKEIAKRRSAK